MSLNPLKWIEWLINEHGSSTILRERLGQARDQITLLENEKASLTSERNDLRVRLQKAETEIDRLNKEHEELKTENAELHRRIESAPMKVVYLNKPSSNRLGPDDM